MGHVKCEKYSLKGEIWSKSLYFKYILPDHFYLCYNLTLPVDGDIDERLNIVFRRSSILAAHWDIHYAAYYFSIFYIY